MRKHAGHFKPSGQEPRRGQGGLRNPPGGRPTKIQIAQQKAELKGLEQAKLALERELGRRAAKIARRYGALAESDPATVRHAVDRVLPAAKQEIEVSGRVAHTVIINTQDPDAGD